ncbi:hypothetical protein RHS01_07508 [Rhizoctonia solani]|uniref:Uncharacterized protein n=1 Tax=Rhizoctonia solani TaxID=456999 RepID=A0A8H7M517_9AGAM|nr:hypothetical protein RHS01_07508 [Rhizoctonia solani]
MIIVISTRDTVHGFTAADQGTTGQSHNTSKTPKQALPTSFPLTSSTNETKGIAPRPTARGRSSEAKRALVEVVDVVDVADVRPTADAAALGPAIASPPTPVTSPNPSVASPNLSFGSPSIATSSPSLSGVGSSAASPKLCYSLASHLTCDLSRFSVCLSTGPRTTTDADSNSLAARIDFLSSTSADHFVTAHPSFVTAKTPASDCTNGPSTMHRVIYHSKPPSCRKAITPVPTVAHIRKSNSAGRPKRANGREMSEQEVQEVLAGDHYPSGGCKTSTGGCLVRLGVGRMEIKDRGTAVLRLLLCRPQYRTRATVGKQVNCTEASNKSAPATLPMMMTSPIRATGVSSSSLPPSFSPLRRLLKNAGVKSIEEVLNKGGVMGLKDEMKREDKREREVVDLTSDADEDDAPVSGHTARTPPRTSRPID